MEQEPFTAIMMTARSNRRLFTGREKYREKPVILLPTENFSVRKTTVSNTNVRRN